MNIQFNRVEAIKKTFDKGQKATEELKKLALDYFLFGAITSEEKEELLVYMQPKENSRDQSVE